MHSLRGKWTDHTQNLNCGTNWGTTSNLDGREGFLLPNVRSSRVRRGKQGHLTHRVSEPLSCNIWPQYTNNWFFKRLKSKCLFETKTIHFSNEIDTDFSIVISFFVSNRCFWQTSQFLPFKLDSTFYRKLGVAGSHRIIALSQLICLFVKWEWTEFGVFHKSHIHAKYFLHLRWYGLIFHIFLRSRHLSHSKYYFVQSWNDMDSEPCLVARPWQSPDSVYLIVHAEKFDKPNDLSLLGNW